MWGLTTISGHFYQAHLYNLMRSDMTVLPLNTLPIDIREASSLNIFKRKLKYHLLILAFNQLQLFGHTLESCLCFTSHSCTATLLLSFILFLLFLRFLLSILFYITFDILFFILWRLNSLSLILCPISFYVKYLMVVIFLLCTYKMYVNIIIKCNIYNVYNSQFGFTLTYRC